MRGIASCSASGGRECRFELAEGLRADAVAHAVVLRDSDSDVLAVLVGDSGGDRDDFGIKETSLLGGESEVVGTRREGVLLLACYAIFSGNVLGRDTERSEFQIFSFEALI